MATVETLILGAGLSGLAAAHRLEGGFHIIEKSERPGGLCKSELRHTSAGTFTFDHTGHWLHLRDPAIRALVDALAPGAFTEIERQARIYSHGVFTRYPYQVNTFGLPPKVVRELLLGFHQAQFGEAGRALREREPQTFAEFILRHLGQGFADHFMFPYNAKLYTVHPRELSAAWCGRFVPKPTLEQVVGGALGIADDQLGYNVHFIYPKQGGIETLPKAFLPEVTRRGPVECGVAPVRIDARRKQVALADGRVLHYRHLISSIPPQAILALLRAGGEVPASVDAAAEKLRAVWTTYVNVGARAPDPKMHWVYFPEPRFPFYRAGSPSATYAGTAPPGHCSFYVEFSRQMAEYPHDQAAREAVAGLVDCGLLQSPAQVLFADVRTIQNSYVLYDAAYGPAREALLAYLTSVGITPVGRYGNWEYSSMEDAIRQGRAAADRLRGTS